MSMTNLPVTCPKNHANPPIHALIVSAGVGSRFGADKPKQYLSLAGRTVLEHAVACLNIPQIDSLTIVISADDGLARSLPFEFDKSIHFATGGAERFLSVKAGVESIARRTEGEAWVLIHDGARPCLSRADLERLLDAMPCVMAQPNMAGAILATPVADTLKLAKTTELNRPDTLPHFTYIHRTVSREQLWQAQTPQLFTLSALQTMLNNAITEGISMTDEASGFEHYGQGVALVQGSRTNIKLTYPDDLAMIELILQAKISGNLG